MWLWAPSDLVAPDEPETAPSTVAPETTPPAPPTDDATDDGSSEPAPDDGTETTEPAEEPPAEEPPPTTPTIVVEPVAEPQNDAPPPEAAPATPPEDTPPPEPTGPVFTPGVQMFLRAEGRINPDFNGADNTPPDVAAVLERARLQLGATWGPVGGFVQLQDARSWGFEGSTTANEANTDLHQGWLELSGAMDARGLSGSVRAGRQEIAWGSQRIIGSLLWAPPARSFDAVRLQGKAGKLGADLFLSLMAPPSTFGVEDPLRPDLPPTTVQSRGDQLGAAMVSYAAHEAFAVEAMVLADFADASPAAPARERRILDFGGRVFGKPVAGLSYEAEGHGQAGEDGGLDHRAWAWTANAAYVHQGERIQPGAKLGYSMASGSSCAAAPGTGCGTTVDRDFFNFYPTNHIHYGLVDLLGWRNMRDLEVAGTLGVAWMNAAVSYHFFQLHEETGRWRNAGGGLVGAGWDPTNTEHGLGHELDVVVTMKPWKPLMIQPGYGVFIPTGAGETLAGPSAQHFAYLWLVATF